jgi:hypothetical protein
MLEAGFNYLVQNKLYIWKRRKNKINTDQKIAIPISGGNVSTGNLQNGVRLGGNKLRDLAWSLDVLDLNKNISSK